jgi:hypothetical protein
VICQYAKQKGYDFQQYRLDGQVIFEYSVGPLRNDIVNGFSNYYKTFIVKKDVSEQREFFNLRLNHYIEERIKTL